jgi:hypothetical protein
MNKITISILSVLIAAAIVGAYFFPTVTPKVVFGSPNGSTYLDGSTVWSVYSPATAAASSTSILNNTTNTWYIISTFVACNGVNGQGGTFTAATTSIPNLGLQNNTNYIAQDVATTTTASLSMYVASSTEGVLTYTSRIWPAGTYLTFVDSTTNAGVCTPGANYISF